MNFIFTHYLQMKIRMGNSDFVVTGVLCRRRLRFGAQELLRTFTKGASQLHTAGLALEPRASVL